MGFRLRKVQITIMVQTVKNQEIICNSLASTEEPKKDEGFLLTLVEHLEHRTPKMDVQCPRIC